MTGGGGAGPGSHRLQMRLPRRPPPPPPAMAAPRRLLAPLLLLLLLLGLVLAAPGESGTPRGTGDEGREPAKRGPRRSRRGGRGGNPRPHRWIRWAGEIKSAFFGTKILPVPCRAGASGAAVTAPSITGSWNRSWDQSTQGSRTSAQGPEHPSQGLQGPGERHHC